MRRPLMIGRIVDRLTPPRLRIYYGPDQAARHLVEGGGFSWRCPPCVRRGSDHGQTQGFTTTLERARAEADWHARSRHWLMRVVYEPGSEG